MTRTPSGGAERLFRMLVALYPKDFRDRYGDDLIREFRRDAEHARFKGRAGAVRFWSHLIRDNLRAARHARHEPKLSTDTRSHLALWADVKHAARALRRDTLYTSVAVLTLSIGIGATTVVGTVVYGVLIAPLPLHEPSSLVRVFERERENPNARMVAYGNYADLRAESEAFEELAIWAYQAHTLTGTDQALRLRSRQVSANFAAALGAIPALGRWLSQDEEESGAAVVVLSHSLWQNAFGGDANIVERTIRLDAEPYEVVGVMSPAFDYPNASDIWLPLAPVTDPLGQRQWHRHNMVARLAPGISIERANALTEPVAARLERAFPETNGGNFFEIISVQDDAVGWARQALSMVLGAVVVLLTIACVNIASLSLTRSTARSRELAVRAALGASRGRIASLLLGESLLIGLVGGVVGLVIAWFGTGAIIDLSAGAIPRSGDVGITLPVVLGALAVSLLSGALVALVPLRHLHRDGALIADGLLSGGRTSSTRRVIRSRRILVGAELALAVILTSGAGLLVQSLSRLTTVDVGVETENVLTMSIRVAGGRYPTSPAAARFVESLMTTIEGIPGIERAGATLTPPVVATGWFNGLTIRDRPVSRADVPPISYVVASSGYFESLGVRVVEGETYRPDADGVDQVAVVNRAAAEQHWPNENVLGKRILGNVDGDSAWARVIGVVENIRQSLWEPARPEVFVPIIQDRVLGFVVTIKTAGDPVTFSAAVQDAIHQADPDIPITQVSTLANRIGNRVAQPRFNATILSTFAIIALVLACVGIFGVLSFSVTQRKREFGIRMAVGADGRQVVRTVLGEAGMLASLGVGLGVVGALATSRMLASLLFDIEPGDPRTLIAVALTVVAVTLLSAILPARRATRVDPVTVLKQE